MHGFLSSASAAARERVAAAAARVPLAHVRRRAEATPPPARLAEALRAPGVGVIAEVKRASPSRGRLAPIDDPAALAHAYVEGGAAAVSVLTEPRWFAGSMDDLAAVAGGVDVPVVCKDFVVDPYQVFQARAAGAAAVLLIVAALDDDDLRALVGVADMAGLDALVEVHDAGQVSRAAAAVDHRRLVVGVNARDMSSLAVDPDRFASLSALLPHAAVRVAESGVFGPADVLRLGALGADAVLVGEHVVTAADPAAAVRRLVQAGLPATSTTQEAPR